MGKCDLSDDKLALEVLVHFVDKNGKRIQPVCNRIQIPLQVTSISKEENAMITMIFNNAICSRLCDVSILQRLVRSLSRVEMLKAQYGNDYDKLQELEAFPILDSIEIQDIPHTC